MISNKELAVLRGGKAIPEAFLRQRREAAKKQLAASFPAPRPIDRQAARYFKELQPKPDYKDPKKAAAVKGLLELHQQRVKQKLNAPKVAREFSGILPGRFGATVAPPFDYAYTEPFLIQDAPQLIGSVNKNTGQMSAGAFTGTDGHSIGTMYTEMGIYLHPAFGPADLIVSAAPSFSFDEATNSLTPDAAVRSFGSVAVSIYAQTGEIGPINATDSLVFEFDQQPAGQLQFDFGSNTDVRRTAQMGVDPSFQCALFVSIVAHVEGIGWPGSVASSHIVVSVPSISFELQPILRVSLP
jgi:hypothetical protein